MFFTEFGRFPLLDLIVFNFLTWCFFHIYLTLRSVLHLELVTSPTSTRNHPNLFTSCCSSNRHFSWHVCAIARVKRRRRRRATQQQMLGNSLRFLLGLPLPWLSVEMGWCGIPLRKKSIKRISKSKNRRIQDQGARSVKQLRSSFCRGKLWNSNFSTGVRWRPDAMW